MAESSSSADYRCIQKRDACMSVHDFSRTNNNRTVANCTAEQGAIENSATIDSAVNNNAAWCSAVAASHGLEFELYSDVWLCRYPMPPFYPNLITLRPVINADHWLDQLSSDLPGGWGIKDSFSTLNLSGDYFVQLFEAHWYCRSALTALAITGQTTQQGLPFVAEVKSYSELKLWECAWSGKPLSSHRIFLPALSGSSAIRFIYTKGLTRASQWEAGLILNTSGKVAGISNLFGTTEGIMSCVEYAANLYPNKALVGYGSAGELTMLSGIGFTRLADLQVWLYSQTQRAR